MQVPVSVFEAALFIVNIWRVDFFSSFRPLKDSYFEINEKNFRKEIFSDLKIDN